MLLHVVVACVLAGPAQDCQQAEPADVNDLSLEVNALQTLHSLNLSAGQLRKLQGWAKETAEKPRKREAAKVSKEYRDKLLELRAALADGSDDDKIDQLNEELEELRNTEKPTLDDNVDLTPAARKRIPEALRLLKVQQLHAVLAGMGDELFDPLDRLLEQLPKTRELKGNEWKQRREEIVDEIVRLAAGIDSKKAGKLSDQLTALLSKAHGMSDAEFKAKRSELEKTARKLLGELGPLEVLRHAVEYELAELLSNPRLAAALEARLKNAR
jgi:hypothetical protein